MIHISAPRPKADSNGAIATARRDGPLPTPADGFADDAAELARRVEEFLERAARDGWDRLTPTPHDAV
jgi:hypothetical protein